MKYTSGNYTVECLDTHINDGIHLMATAPASTERAVLSISVSGNTFVENRMMHNGKCEFDISEYLKVATQNEPVRFLARPKMGGTPAIAFHNTDTAVSSLCGLLSVSITFDGHEVSIPTSQFELFAGYSAEWHREEHLFNPNFEHLAEFYSDNDKIGLSLEFNRDGEALYQYSSFGAGRKWLYQFKLNEYWDERYNTEGQTLRANLMEQDESAVYYIDTRTKGCYLRFTDENGKLQQLLLDIEGIGKSFADTDSFATYEGKRSYYEVYGTALVNNGNSVSARRTQNRVLHCSVSNLPKGLVNDLSALMMSPEVYMLVDAEQNKWQKVRVTGAELLAETKKAHISAKFDVITLSENTLW